MFNRFVWLKAGLATAFAATAMTWLSLLVCRVSDSHVCNAAGTVFDFLNAPARLATEAVLRKIATSLGLTRVGPDFVAAPPGVSETLRILSWLSFLGYWFIIGAGVLWITRLIKRRRLTDGEAIPPSPAAHP